MKYVNASIINSNILSESKNTTTKRTQQKPITSKSLPNHPLEKVVTLGHSIVKHVSGSKILQKLNNFRVKVITFSGATMQCMADYTYRDE